MTMDTSKDDAFYMHISNGEKVRFGSARKGIYAMDDDTLLCHDKIWTRKLQQDNHPSPVYYDTIEENIKKYPRRLYL